jgi:putative transposase
MNAHPYPTDLTDAAWDYITAMIPPPTPGGRPRELDRRAVVKAIFYVVDGGLTWRRLPQEYPTYHRVYGDVAPWRDRGDGPRLPDPWRAHGRHQAGRHTQPTAGALESQRVKPPERGGARGSESGTKGTGRPRPL